jgi:hypothetical protein
MIRQHRNTATNCRSRHQRMIDLPKCKQAVKCKVSEMRDWLWKIGSPRGGHPQSFKLIRLGVGASLAAFSPVRTASALRKCEHSGCYCKSRFRNVPVLPDAY